MGLFDNFIKKSTKYYGPLNCYDLCQRASKIIRYYDKPDIDDVYYDEPDPIDDNLLYLESIIISFYLLCYRFKNVENYKGNIEIYWMQDNDVLRQTFLYLWNELKKNDSIKLGYIKITGEKLSKEEFEKELFGYLTSRYNNYCSCIFFDNNDEPEHRITNFSNAKTLFDNPFTNRYDLKYYTTMDYHNNGGDIDAFCIDFYGALEDAYNLIKNTIK